MATRVAVLASGSGSNLQALLDAASADAPFRIVRVVANRPDAFALERAAVAGVPARLIDHTEFAERETFEAAVTAQLADDGAEWICLAGFMRVLTASFVERWHDRMLNVHPSLLPAFKGLNTHRRVLAAGLRVTGCTVHVVRPALDDGPVVVQAAVPVLEHDDDASLAARVLAMEHRAYPLALRLVTSGAAVIEGDRVRLVRTPPPDARNAPSGFLWPAA
ncbi:MAG: phosphoribosylglycinamide formyltransferase [Pseudomonadota bacterium]